MLATRFSSPFAISGLSGISALHLQVDLHGHAKIEDLRHHVGRLEIEQQIGERLRSSAQPSDVLFGRTVIGLQRDLDDAVVDADDRIIGEREIKLRWGSPILSMMSSRSDAGMTSRIRSSTAWKYFSVSSIRVRAGARTWSWMRPGRRSERSHARPRRPARPPSRTPARRSGERDSGG